jgi:hypothetical protein
MGLNYVTMDYDNLAAAYRKEEIEILTSVKTLM